MLDSFEGSEELFLSVGTAYIVTAALNFFGMERLEDKPTKNKFPDNISSETEENKKKFFDAFGRFIDKFLFQKDNNCTDEDDYVKNYALCFIFLTILIMQMKGTAAEADGERNLINKKLLLYVFKSLGAYSKYAIEMFVSIAQIECLLTPRLSEEFKWGFFANWRGGAGKNIEDDLLQGICNRDSKSVVQRMGPNKTLNSISKVCKQPLAFNKLQKNLILLLAFTRPQYSTQPETHLNMRPTWWMILSSWIHSVMYRQDFMTAFQISKGAPALYEHC